MNWRYDGDPEEILNRFSPEECEEIEAILRKLKPDERAQVLLYVWIFLDEDFQEHWEVNDYITDHDKWDEFPEIRSFNDHARANELRGITPRFFAIVCEILGLDDFPGSPLIRSRKY